MNDVVLVFDLDDTLYPERDFVRSGFKAVDEWCRREGICDAFFDTAWGILDSGERLRVFDRALQCLGVADAANIVPELVELYRNHMPAIALFPDAERVLAHFGALCDLAVLTDGLLTTQKNKVSALGLETKVKLVVYSDEFGRDGWKPSAAPYVKTMQHFGQSKSFVYVADNPVKDFVGARALGWRTVQVQNGGFYSNISVPPAYEPDVRIRRLQELINIPLAKVCEPCPTP